MADLHSIERIWFGEDSTARLVRVALAPLAAVYGGVVHLRGLLYDRGVLASHRPALPTLSVGNLTVGGTGKTPVAAWLVRRFRDLGAMPAIVLRGYGDDEPIVHRELNPGVPVIVSPDRLRGIAVAAAEGATVAVLDDAFQHRRAGRQGDLVLISAERWTGPRRLIPAGPWREPASALRRASVVLVTRKAAELGEARKVRDEIARLVPHVPCSLAHLPLGEVCAAEGDARRTLESLRGTHVLAIAAVGDPRTFIRQLGATGAEVRFSIYPDHHAFTTADAEAVAASLEPGELPICTRKDAVKLRHAWPRDAAPLWYVSQQVVVEDGGTHVTSLLSTVLGFPSTDNNPPAVPPATHHAD